METKTARFNMSVGIPRKIHQIWLQGAEHLKTKFPKKFDWTQTVTNNMHPTWTYTFWSEKELLPMVDEVAGLRAVWDEAPNLACRADIGRGLILRKHGGLYLDIDYLVLKDFTFLFTPDIQFLCVRLDTLKPYEREYIDYNNAVLGCAPGFELMESWLQCIVEDGPFRSGRQKHKHSSGYQYTARVTGFLRLNRLLKDGKYPTNPAVRIVSNTMLEPLTLNNQHQMCDSVDTCQAKFPSAYGIHLTDGSWMEGRKALHDMGKMYGELSDCAPILVGVFIVLFVLCLMVIVYLVFKRWYRCPRLLKSANTESASNKIGKVRPEATVPPVIHSQKK
jgi:hypothetical protein